MEKQSLKWKTWSEIHNGFIPVGVSPALFRLQRLVSRGYLPDWEETKNNHIDTLSLKHPKRKFKSSLIWLCEDGFVYDDEKNGVQVRIAPDDSEEFERFAQTVPLPNWWDYNSRKISLIIGLFIIFLPIFFIISILKMLTN